MKTQKLLSLGVAAVAVASIAAGSLAFVDGGGNSASALGLTDSQVNQIALNVSQTAEADREAYLQKIAGNLGVDLAKLKEAIGKANISTLDEKVAAGSISQERADAMRERLAAGDTFFHGGKGGPGGQHGRGGPGGIGANSEALATFFGIDAATLRTEMQTKSLATIAAENGKSVDQLKSFLAEQAKTSLAEKVAAGDLTQAEADEKLAELESRLDEQINEVHTHGPKGARGHGPAGETAPANAQ